MKVPIAVVDTNVVVSGLVTSDAAAPTAVLLDHMIAGSVRFLLSRALIAEYRTVLLRPKIVKLHGLGEAEIDVLLTDIVANGIVREPETASVSAPDPGDDHLWALAQAQADVVVVTGDRLLVGHPPPGVSVLSPGLSWTSCRPLIADSRGAATPSTRETAGRTRSPRRAEGLATWRGSRASGRRGRPRRARSRTGPPERA